MRVRPVQEKIKERWEWDQTRRPRGRAQLGDNEGIKVKLKIIMSYSKTNDPTYLAVNESIHLSEMSMLISPRRLVARRDALLNID